MPSFKCAILARRGTYKVAGLLEILILGTINVDFTRWELVSRHEIYMCFETEK